MNLFLSHLPWELLNTPSGNFNQDIMGDFQKSFNHFVQSGQVWALMIGIFVGYLFKSLTSF
ncbi:hypothetical protein DO97_14595 [Neosynechococcus sphagnicola sy1]|uniref:Uncharacterized protein n=1 Tax=Neosynechococcus sphagnicola sy1 TaxID=1497020 RepID=A0A098TIL0_9CYAN|nr:hypothetical protein DO97_14595 [Neosynechococcus sphagnicola sy1]